MATETTMVIHDSGDERYLVVWTDAHTQVALIRAGTTADALSQFIRRWIDDGLASAIGPAGGGRYSHPLECIEAWQKASPDHDELEVDDAGRLLSTLTWSIRRLSSSVLECDFASVFTGPDPTSITTDIRRARELMNADCPAVRPRAFTWLLREGVLVTFYEREIASDRFTVYARYLVRFGGGIDRWDGTYDEIVSNLWIEFPIG